VKANFALGRFCGEVRGRIIDRECHHSPSSLSAAHDAG
jgi:hypothetical protein